VGGKKGKKKKKIRKKIEEPWILAIYPEEKKKKFLQPSNLETYLT